MTPNVLFLSGSLRLEGSNSRLTRVAARQLPLGFEATFFDLVDVPPYNADLDQAGQTPDAVTELRRRVTDAAGVFWCTPEHNYSLPGVVKNVIDWASGPLLPQSCLVGRPMNAAVATSSLTNGARSFSGLKRYWGIAGGLVVPLPDCIINQAPDKFRNVDGELSLEPTSLRLLRLAVDGLVRMSESGAHRALEENWHASIQVLAA